MNRNVVEKKTIQWKMESSKVHVCYFCIENCLSLKENNIWIKVELAFSSIFITFIAHTRHTYLLNSKINTKISKYKISILLIFIKWIEYVYCIYQSACEIVDCQAHWLLFSCHSVVQLIYLTRKFLLQIINSSINEARNNFYRFCIYIFHQLQFGNDGKIFIIIPLNACKDKIDATFLLFVCVCLCGKLVPLKEFWRKILI